MPSTFRPAARSRSSAEAKYRELRRLAFQAAGEDLVAAGASAELRAIDAAALVAAGQWTGRRVAWPWHVLAADWRRNHPPRFEVAVWRDAVLCGLALGRPASAAAHLSVYFLEANPDHANPLRRNVARVALGAARRYALVLGKTELRLIDPLPVLVPFYCSPALGFELVAPGTEAQYCSRSI